MPLKPIAVLPIPKNYKNYLDNHKPKWKGVSNPKNCIFLKNPNNLVIKNK